MIRLALFGGIELADPANPESSAILGQRKRVALLVYLTLAGPDALRSRDAVLALFWPEFDQRRARGALRQALYSLRLSLGRGAIVTRSDGSLGTSPDAVWCDAVAFEQALKSGDPEEALRLYRGDLLPGFFVDDAPGFERWLDEERPRLRRKVREAAWRLADDAEQRGDLANAARWARRCTELSHDDEVSLQKLLRLLDRAGDRAGALHAYQEFAARLAKDFDAAPSAETRRLIVAIRERAAGSAPNRLPVVLEAAIASTAPSTPTSPPVPSARVIGSGPRHAMRRSLLWLAASAMMIALLVGLAGLLHHTLSRGRGPASNSRVRIVVDDFTDLTTPSRRGVFGPAITAAVVDKLAAVRSFDVASARNPGRARDDDPRGARLPRFVVTGSVLRSGARVRVNVELIDATAGSTLGTSVLEHESSDSMALVDALSGDVSSAIRVAIGRELRSRDRYVASTHSSARRLAEEASTERDMARDLEHEGRFSTAARALRRADSLLAIVEAIAPAWREPMIERAHVAWELAVLHLSSGSHDVVRADALLREGIVEAERAVAADSADATALETLGLLSYWYWLQIPLPPDSTRAALARAMSALRSAVAMDPGRASAWNLLSAALYSQADYKGAYLAAYRAYQADAYLDDAAEVLSRLFASAYEIGDDVGARRWCDEINHRFEGSWTGAYCQLGLLAWGSSAGDPAAVRQAWAIVTAGGRRTPLVREMGPRLYMLVAVSLARAGLRDSAEAIIRRSRVSAAGDPEILPLEASARIILGQPDSAVARLAQYVRAKPLHRTAVACSRRFAGLRALDRQRTVFRPCDL
ncbi:MAG TPA: BTAD domain-containing putative transcriptional regulator [Gemmatimonadaceae bacterium]|nr:BTAD domain-containing putative transcriptional regulator [Gemmatimonadaceae bacterium]